MKFPVLLFFFSIFLFPCKLVAQETDDITFKFFCVPTSTTDYSIEITRSRLVLNQNDKIPAKRENSRGQTPIRKMVSSEYTYLFNVSERKTVDSIISIYSLDSAGLYQKRNTEWGSVWKITITRESITNTIDLPNYTNAGLESLISFIVCLIPKEKRPRFECKQSH
jgi:hypothetical protein